MSRLGDVLYFLRQIFFPNWTERKDNAEPTQWQKILAAVLLFLTSRNGTGTIFSIILHAFILVVLSFIMIHRQGTLAGIDILGGFNIPSAESEPLIVAPNEGEQSTKNVEPQDTATTESPLPAIPEANYADTQPTTPAVETVADSESPGAEPLQVPMTGGFVGGGGFQNRTPAGRQRAMQNGDSSPLGEAAVEAGLEWLAAHQQKDGGWSLYFADSCGRCSHSGTSWSNRRTAATALALLSFLGAGYSHQTESRHKRVVESGLSFLIRDVNGGIDGEAIKRDDLRMYSHGLATIALCEAYAMTKEQDPKSLLGVAAQRSLQFIETAQDSEGGGWRYRPNQQPGDTSIFSWQLMALKSGRIGGLNVSQSVLYGAQDFLESVKWDGGRRYNYLPSGEWDANREDSPKTCTAIGLLMRMYLGWKPGNPFLDDGMGQIVRWGYTQRAGQCNLYYAYYAALALHHYGGEHWESWNGGLQELLIRTQSRQQGCEFGSWYFQDSYCDIGGRLLNTALAVMILETPYRIMPLYREIR